MSSAKGASINALTDAFLTREHYVRAAVRFALNSHSVFLLWRFIMPPRLNKRQLRELEELQALEASPGTEVVEEVAQDEEPTSSSPKKMTGGFAAVSSLHA